MSGDMLPHQPGVEFTDAQVALIKRTICKPKDRIATNDELALFIGQCKRTNLDPFASQIYAIFRKDKRLRDEVMTIQTAIDGFRVIAERSNRYIGQAGPYWCGADGQWREIWIDDQPPVAAKVLVRKIIGGQIGETPAVAHFREYAPRYPSGDLMGLWPIMPAGQLAKCAEALALRKAFPNDLSGLYVDAEMERADAEAQVIAPAGLLQGAPAARDEMLRDPTPAADGDRLLSDEERAELVQTCAARGFEDMTMLLTSVGAESTDDLTVAQRDSILARLLDAPATSTEREREPVEARA